VIVAVASGKGGTGKTTVAVHLARMLRGEVELLDCDVEAPNDHLFLRPTRESVEPVGILVPKVDVELCTACGQCSEICQYNALAVLRDRVIVFPELCHGCGGCALACPERAISEVSRPIGVVESGGADGVRLIQGRLNVGEALAPPLIRAVRARARGDGLVLIDSPPGTSCSMIAAVRAADLSLLVTEPTPFGLNDLKLAVEALRTLGIPSMVVVNRAGTGDRRVHEYCADQDLEIALEIPDDRRIAEAYARGEDLTVAVPGTKMLFEELADRIQTAGGIG
jgi:MinD superfamily P-loop ATPase